RRHWLRTVAKRGYVFEPPAPVEPVVDEDIVPTLDVAPAGRPEASPGASPAIRRVPAPGRRAASLAVLATVLAVVIMVLAMGRRGVPPLSPMPVSLIVLADPADTAAAVPAGLLEAWLTWQLTMLPEVQLL